MKPTNLLRASMTLSALLIAGQSANGQFNPIALTPESYTYDMVVERTAAIPPIPRGYYTTATMDGGAGNTGNTWNERGYFAAAPNTGLPLAGETVVSLLDATHSFQFAPSYTANNALVINATTFRNSTATLVTPTALHTVAFLTSGGNGGCTFRYTITHADGSTQVGTTTSPDWFNVTTDVAYIASGRVNAQDFSNNNIGTQNPRLYSRLVPVTNTTSPVQKIDIEYVSSANNAHSAIMAISGRTTADGNIVPVPFTGYNADIVVEEAAPERQSLVNAGFTTASMDNGALNTGNTWYEQGYAFNAPTTGLPAAGSTVTATVRDIPHSYTFAPSYTAANAALLNTASPNVAFIPQTPAAYTGLSLLAASSGGAGTIGYSVTHADNSVQEGTLSIPDWFNQNPTVVTAAGRVNNDTSVLADVNSTNPRLYAVDFALNNTSSPVTRIDLEWTGGGNRSAVFAVSGTQAALAPFFIRQPASIKVDVGGSANFTASVSGTQPLTLQWQRGVNGVFTDLTDGGNISGAQTDSLTVANAQESDGADYRLVVTNTSGTATSTAVPLVVITPLQSIQATAANITGFGGSWPGAEGPANAMNGNTTKYLNRGLNEGANPFRGPVGFTVNPTQGRTILGAIIFYTANDADGRDPMDYKVEGSDDGVNWVLIQQGPLNLPLGRNAANLALNPITQNIQQVLINNSTAYTSYKVSFNTVRTMTGGLFQIGEVDLRGTVDTSGRPFFSAQPGNAVAIAGGTATFTATASGTPEPAIRWERSVNGGAFTPLADGPNVTGSQTGTLQLSNVTMADAVQYRAVATSTAGTANSSTVSLRVLSALLDVTTPTDLVEAFGDTAGTFHGNAANPSFIIDDTTSKYINGGSGFSAAAGFPPFAGPVGVVIFPAGPTIVSGLRVYTADGNNERDPINYKLEGSNNEGASYSLISEGALALPATRNPLSQNINPLTHAMQEVGFANQASYTSYKLSFLDVAAPNTANSLQVAEIELLGVSGTSGPEIDIAYSNGSITITWPGNGMLQSITDLSQAGNPNAWTNIGNTGTYSEAVAGTPAKYFRVQNAP